LAISSPDEFLVIFAIKAEPYVLVIDSSSVLQLRTSLSIAGVAENMWCSTLKIAF